MKAINYLLFPLLLLWKLLISIWSFLVKFVEYSSEQSHANRWRQNIQVGDDCYFYAYNGDKVSGFISKISESNQGYYFIKSHGKTYYKHVLDIYPA